MDAASLRLRGLHRTAPPGDRHERGAFEHAGEELVTASAKNDQLRGKILEILSERMAPQRLQRLEEGVRAGQPRNLPRHRHLQRSRRQKHDREQAEQGGKRAVCLAPQDAPRSEQEDVGGDDRRPGRAREQGAATRATLKPGRLTSPEFGRGGLRNHRPILGEPPAAAPREPSAGLPKRVACRVVSLSSG